MATLGDPETTRVPQNMDDIVERVNRPIQPPPRREIDEMLERLTEEINGLADRAAGLTARLEPVLSSEAPESGEDAAAPWHVETSYGDRIAALRTRVEEVTRLVVRTTDRLQI